MNLPEAIEPRDPLPIELEVLRNRCGSLRLLLHLADLEECDMRRCSARLERGPATEAALLARGLRELVRQYLAAVQVGGLESTTCFEEARPS